MSEKEKDSMITEDSSVSKKRGRRKKTEEPAVVQPQKESKPEEVSTVEKKPKRKTSEKSSAEQENLSTGKKEAKKNKVEARVIFQQGGYQLEPKLILEQAKANWFAKGHKESELKSIELYIKPEEWSAYYVINGEGGADNKIDLNVGLLH